MNKKKNLFNNIYFGKTVLVTGHTGFKGSWLCIWLIELGAKVIGFGLDPYTQNDNFVVTGLKDMLIDIRGDIRDSEKLQQVFEEYKPEIVFHLAAQPLVRLSYEIPKETYEINIMGTVNILECIKNSRYTKVGIMVTTDKCYENKERLAPYKEDDPLGGYDPYSSSKGCAEIISASYRNSFMNPVEYEKHGKAIASVRAGNVIGGGDWAKDRIIPDCIRALTDNKRIEIRNPNAVRPWQYVLEPLRGYLLLASKMHEDGVSYSSGWNFGPKIEDMMTVRQITELIISKWGSGSCICGVQENMIHEANLLNLDCSKAKEYIGWEIQLNIREAIEFTVEWYKILNTTNMLDFCKKQILAYENIVN